MKRNLTALGIALVAVVAMGTAVTSAATAAQLTAASYPAHIIAEDVAGENSIFTGLFGISVECESTFYTSEITGSTENVTITPEYSGCKSGARDSSLTLNGCTYTHRHTGSGHTYSVTTDLMCPSNQKLEIHIYNPHVGNGTWCTLTTSAQTGLTGLVAHDETGPGVILYTGAIVNMKVLSHGTCSAGLTVEYNGELDVHVRASATNSSGEADAIDVG